jgi:hypothetical protein
MPKILTIITTAIALTIAVAVLSTSVSTASSQGARGASRGDIIRFLTELKPVANRLARQQVPGVALDPRVALTKAITSLETATPAQLAVLQRALSTYPAWRSLPRTLTKLVGRMPAGRRIPLGIKVADDCATARGFGYTQTDVEIATDVARAADVVLMAVPDDTLDVIPHVAATAVWAIPTLAQRGIEHSYNIAQNCDQGDHYALETLNLDAKVSSRATQSSLDALDTHLTTVNTQVTSEFSALDTHVTNVDNHVATEFTALDTHLTNVDNHVAAQFSALTTLVTANNDLNIRMHIEEDLAAGNHPAGLFELPAAQGGYLELTRTIVVDIIQKTLATGQSVGKANSYLASGDQSRTAGKFKSAYALYGQSYRAATVPCPTTTTNCG